MAMVTAGYSMPSVSWANSRHGTRSVPVCRGECLPFLIPDRAHGLGDLLPRKTPRSDVSQAGLLSPVSFEQLAFSAIVVMRPLSCARPYNPDTHGELQVPHAGCVIRARLLARSGTTLPR
jgi:hypothetical protein